MPFTVTKEHDRNDQQESVDYDDLDKALAGNIEAKLQEWFADKKIKLSGEWFKVGNQGSLSVNASDGHWNSFEEDASGQGLLSLYAWRYGVAIEQAAEDLKAESSVIRSPVQSKPKPKAKVEKPNWQHADLPPSEIPTEHFENGEADHVYKYRDRAGKLIGVVLRWNESFDRDSKDIRPISWVHVEGNSEPEWKWCHFAKPRPLYRGERIDAEPDAPILIVEGEKCVEAAEKALPDWIVLSWAGGASSAQYADWKGFEGRHVVIWPDNDEGGHKAAEEIRKAIPAALMVDTVGLGEKDDIDDVLTAKGAEYVRELLPREESLFVDLSEVLDGDLTPERPTIAPCMSGECLLYAGRINEIHGEPSVGKTNITLAIITTELVMGNKVLFIDPEDNPKGIVKRMLAFGIDTASIRANLKYLHDPTPEEIIQAQAWADRHHPSIVSGDGLAELVTGCGEKEDDAGSILTFFKRYIRPFTKCGAAVLLSDHVTKSTEGRGTWSRGSGAKMGRYDGASYMLTLAKPYSPTHAGSVKFTIAKDRNGGVGSKNEEVFMAFFEPKDGITQVQIRKLKAEDRLPIDDIKQVIEVVAMHEKGGNHPNKGTIEGHEYEPQMTAKRVRELLKLAVENDYIERFKAPGEHFFRHKLGGQKL